MTDEVLNRKEKQRERIKKWRTENAEHVKAYMKKWKAENAGHNSEYQKAYQAEYNLRNEVQFKNWVRNLKRNYQLTPDQFNEIWANQDGKCAICDVQLKPRGRSHDAAVVDHNHATGEVRGILCRACNHGIGNLKDDPKVLKAAAEYLIRNGNYSHIRKALK